MNEAIAEAAHEAGRAGLAGGFLRLFVRVLYFCDGSEGVLDQNCCSDGCCPCSLVMWPDSTIYL